MIIGHMQHNARDPSRDHRHGRIYRMIASGRPLQAPVPIAGAPLDALMRNLEHPVDGIRYRTRIELSGRNPDEVLRAGQAWMRKFDPKKREHAHPLLEALWLHQRNHVQDRVLMDALLASPEPHARVAAATVWHFWEGVDSTTEAPPRERRPREAVRPTFGPTRALSRTERRIYELGHEVYHREAHCATCHQADGQGLGAVYPPLAASDWIDGDDERLIKIALRGLWGRIEVNGRTFDPATGGVPPMTGFAGLLNDEELAAVLSYVKQSFGNDGDLVSPGSVRRVREATKAQDSFYTAEDILQAHPLR
jgi:mono/diheme cytochrome c family protein